LRQTSSACNTGHVLIVELVYVGHILPADEQAPVNQ
jgi:hypothetical protein